MTKFIIAIILSSCLLLPSLNLTQSAFKEIFSISVIATLVAFWVWKHNKWFGALLFWLLIRSVLPPEQPRMMISLVNVFLGAMAYLAVHHIDIDIDEVKKFVSITCLINIAVVYLQWLNIFFCWNACSDGGRVWGLFGNSNWSGCYIAITLPICLEIARNNKWYYTGILGIPAVFIMGGSFSIVSTLFGVALYLYIENRSLVLKWKLHIVALIAILAATVAILINPPIAKDGGRFELWRRAYKFCLFNAPNNGTFAGSGVDPAYQSHFLYGRGIGEAYRILPMIQPRCYTDTNQMWRQLHNDPLQVLFEYGFIGFFICAGLVVSTARKLSRYNVAIIACLCAMVVNSLGFFPFRTAPIGYLAVIYLALVDRFG